MLISRRHSILALGCGLAYPLWAQPSQPSGLPAAVSLRQELAQALNKGLPLVLMVSLEGCSFCHRVRQSYLLPLLREGVVVVQLNMRSPQVVQDFSGLSTTHDALVRRWKVSIAPTLLFFGMQGRELAERMEGAYLPDFYGSYLQDRLNQSRALLKS